MVTTKVAKVWVYTRWKGKSSKVSKELPSCSEWFYRVESVFGRWKNYAVATKTCVLCRINKSFFFDSMNDSSIHYYVQKTVLVLACARTHTLPLLICGEHSLWTWTVLQNNGPKIIKRSNCLAMIFNIQMKCRVKYVPTFFSVSRNMSKMRILRCNLNHLLSFLSSSS